MGDYASGVTGQAHRRPGLDALRAALTILVVFHHAAITHGADAGYCYRELRPDGGWQSDLLILFCAANQAFFMGLFFLIAGLFTPFAVDRHERWGYLRSRLWRLGLPLLAFVLVIGPAAIALAQTSRGWPFLATLQGICARGVVDIGPLWFALALMVFAGIQVALPWPRIVEAPFPSNIRLLSAALAAGTTAFAIRLGWSVGQQVLGLQFGYFAGYVALFAVGCVAARSGWIARFFPERTRLWLWVVALVLPVLPAAILLARGVP